MPLVAVPAAVIPALFALLFLVAWSVWGAAITRTLNIDLPVIGNVIGNTVATVLNGTYAILCYWLDGLIAPLSRLILAPIAAVENAVGYLPTTFAHVYNSLWNIRNNFLPAAVAAAAAVAHGEAASVLLDAENLYNSAVSHADAVGQEVLADARSLYNQSVGYAAAVGQEVLADAQSLYNQSISYAAAVGQEVLADADHLYDQAVAFSRGAFTEAVTYTAGVGAKIEGDLSAAIDQLETYAQQTATATVGVLATDIDNAITGTLGQIWTDVDGAVTDVIGIIGTGDAAVRDALGRIDWTIPRNIAGVASLASVTTLTMMRYLKECGIPNCQNLGAFGNELQSVIGLVDDGLLLAFLVELIHDPTSAAGLFSSTVGDVISGGLSLGKELIS